MKRFDLLAEVLTVAYVFATFLGLLSDSGEAERKNRCPVNQSCWGRNHGYICAPTSGVNLTSGEFLLQELTNSERHLQRAHLDAGLSERDQKGGVE